MNKPPFFPDLAFGWCFFSALMVLLAAAAMIDLRTSRIPKTLTITIAISGLLISIVRVGWLASQNRETWWLGTGSVWIGMIDGFLFSLCGLLLAFVIFFVMYILGTCGGGDVKLCAGIGAWIGASYVVFLLLVSVVALVIWIGSRIVFGGVPASANRRPGEASTKRNKNAGQMPKRRMTFSVPAAVSAAVVMLWFFRYDLHLDTPPPAPEKESSHATTLPIRLCSSKT
jgi:Flp pilus assembly protein protease CpaA